MGAARKHGILPDNGILPDRDLKRLIAKRSISADRPIEDGQIQPASLDLRLGTTAYRLISSFLPEQSEISKQLNMLDLHQQLTMFDFVQQSDLVMDEKDLTQGAILEKGIVYLVPLLEHVALPPHVRGRANPKSSTGRLDIFTRLITDLSAGFDEIPHGYQGPLYLEVVPRSFPIRVKTGLALNQLRLLTGQPTVSDSELKDLHESDKLLYHNDDDPDSPPLTAQDIRVDHGLFLRIGLRGSGSDRNIVGYKARKYTQAIDPSKIRHYKAQDFWDPIYQNTNDSLILDPQEFYILTSKERIKVPAGYAAEMVAYEAAFGELRTHYAGFFDPGFGAGDGPRKGTQVVLEVRSHDVPFLIHDGQTFFKVVYENMLDLPEHLYGASIGSSYHQQGLTLSKHFKW